MGRRNQELSYEIGGKVLRVSEKKRDLGVIMHKSAKPSKKDYSTLGMVRRTIVTRDKDTILRLYKYCILQVWNKYLKQDLEKCKEKLHK